MHHSDWSFIYGGRGDRTREASLYLPKDRRVTLRILRHSPRDPPPPTGTRPSRVKRVIRVDPIHLGELHVACGRSALSAQVLGPKRFRSQLEAFDAGHPDRVRTSCRWRLALVLAVAFLGTGMYGAWAYVHDYQVYRGFRPSDPAASRQGKLVEVHFQSQALDRDDSYMVYEPTASTSSRHVVIGSRSYISCTGRSATPCTTSTSAASA